MKLRDLEEKRKSINRPSLSVLKNWKNIIGCEIGVLYGLNARDILEKYDVKKLYLIDPYIPYPGVDGSISGEDGVEVKEIAHKYLEKFEDKIIWIEDLSWNAVNLIPDNLDFVYIDGEHTKKAVSRDMKLYYPKVKIGGLFAGHDYDQRAPQVMDAVNEFFGYLEEPFKFGGRWDWWCIKIKNCEII